METTHTHFVRVLDGFSNYLCTVRCFSYDMSVFSTLKRCFSRMFCSATQQRSIPEPCDEGTSVDLPMDPPVAVSEGTSVDPPLLQPSLSEEVELAPPSPPYYSYCKGSSDEIIKYLEIPAPIPSDFFRGITKCQFHFNQPFLQDDFDLLVLYRAVSLDMAIFDGGKTISLLVRVDNRGCSKEVFVVMTNDGWKTRQTLSAHYVSSDTDYNSEKFETEFDANGKGKVEFAILYQVDGASYWDNNQGDNYTITFN